MSSDKFTFIKKVGNDYLFVCNNCSNNFTNNDQMRYICPFCKEEVDSGERVNNYYPWLIADEHPFGSCDICGDYTFGLVGRSRCEFCDWKTHRCNDCIDNSNCRKDCKRNRDDSEEY